MLAAFLIVVAVLLWIWLIYGAVDRKSRRPSHSRSPLRPKPKPPVPVDVCPLPVLLEMDVNVSGQITLKGFHVGFVVFFNSTGATVGSFPLSDTVDTVSIPDGAVLARVSAKASCTNGPLITLPHLSPTPPPPEHCVTPSISEVDLTTAGQISIVNGSYADWIAFYDSSNALIRPPGVQNLASLSYTAHIPSNAVVAIVTNSEDCGTTGTIIRLPPPEPSPPSCPPPLIASADFSTAGQVTLMGSGIGAVFFYNSGSSPESQQAFVGGVGGTALIPADATQMVIAASLTCIASPNNTTIALAPTPTPVTCPVPQLTAIDIDLQAQTLTLGGVVGTIGFVNFLASDASTSVGSQTITTLPRTMSLPGNAAFAVVFASQTCFSTSSVNRTTITLPSESPVSSCPTPSLSTIDMNLSTTPQTISLNGANAGWIVFLDSSSTPLGPGVPIYVLPADDIKMPTGTAYVQVYASQTCAGALGAGSSLITIPQATPPPTCPTPQITSMDLVLSPLGSNNGTINVQGGDANFVYFIGGQSSGVPTSATSGPVQIPVGVQTIVVAASSTCALDMNGTVMSLPPQPFVTDVDLSTTGVLNVTGSNFNSAYFLDAKSNVITGSPTGYAYSGGAIAIPSGAVQAILWASGGTAPYSVPAPLGASLLAIELPPSPLTIPSVSDVNVSQPGQIAVTGMNVGAVRWTDGKTNTDQAYSPSTLVTIPTGSISAFFAPSLPISSLSPTVEVDLPPDAPAPQAQLQASFLAISLSNPEAPFTFAGGSPVSGIPSVLGPSPLIGGSGWLNFVISSGFMANGINQTRIIAQDGLGSPKQLTYSATQVSGGTAVLQVDIVAQPLAGIDTFILQNGTAGNTVILTLQPYGPNLIVALPDFTGKNVILYSKATAPPDIGLGRRVLPGTLLFFDSVPAPGQLTVPQLCVTTQINVVDLPQALKLYSTGNKVSGYFISPGVSAPTASNMYPIITL